MPSLFVSRRWNYKWLPCLREILTTFYFSDLGQQQVFPSHHKMSLELTGKAPSGSSHCQNMASIWWRRLRFDNVNSNVRHSHKKTRLHIFCRKRESIMVQRKIHRREIFTEEDWEPEVQDSKCFSHIINIYSEAPCTFLSVTCWRQDLITITVGLADCCGKKVLAGLAGL